MSTDRKWSVRDISVVVSAVVLALVLAVCLAVKCLRRRAADEAVPSPDKDNMDVAATVIMETAGNMLVGI